MPVSHTTGLVSSAFARHYSQNHSLFSLPEGTEMFHFPSFPPHTLYIQVRVTALDRQRGFPIRTSSDQHPVIDSPRLIADSHVLHRLLVPRHPPCALHNLATQMITTNTQQENHTRHHNEQHPKALLPDGIRQSTHCKTRPHTTTPPRGTMVRDQRCSRPLYSSQTTTYTTTTTHHTNSFAVSHPGGP